jgi:hypothetical protein
VAADSAPAAELIEKARHPSVPELNDEVARIKAAAADQDARGRAVHAKRASGAGPTGREPSRATSTAIPKTAPGWGGCSIPSGRG